MTHQTINEQWKSFERAVLTRGASEIQRREMKRAFFAGWLSAFKSATQLAHDLSEDEACARMERYATELEGFHVAITMGGA